MAKNRKKRKPRKGMTTPRRRISTKLDFQNDLGEKLVNSINEDMEILETDFGPIKISDGSVVYALKNKGAFMPIATFSSRINADDKLEVLQEYERLNQQFPEEPFIHVQIASCYNDLNQKEKYAKRLEENFLKYKGYPLVDIEYMLGLIKVVPTDLYESTFGTALNIHDQYPNLKAFNPYTVSHFYGLKTKYFVDMEKYELAMQCVDIVKQLDPFKSKLLSAMVLSASDPSYRRKTIIARSIFAIVVLAIIVGIIWGIIKLFQWIF